MKRKLPGLVLTMLAAGVSPLRSAEPAAEVLGYHPIKVDSRGNIVPWYDPDPGKAYGHGVDLVWQFWDRLPADLNGLPYYLNHQVWNPRFGDPRGIGGDQFAMALSSWRLYYAYSGNERVKANMRLIADTYLTRGLSPATAEWPNLPFPYNTLLYSGVYDGDMRAGLGVTQPDKAGSFGRELLHLYKMSAGYNIPENPRYLQAAIAIADTLARHVTAGDRDHSPLPFKVNVFTGKTAPLRTHDFTGTPIDLAGYTSNWTPTMELFLGLIELHQGDVAAYQQAFDRLLLWMKTYPLKENKWGPFFEDVDWWSDTQINAMTCARFIMEHRALFPEWQQDVRGIIAWTQATLGNHQWQKYGVRVCNEQTVYPVPGNSHTSRQSADELLYGSLTGDPAFRANAVRALNWATYMVDADGTNCYPTDEPWLTDGYGDYVRHYLRAMAAAPELSPADEDHILSSTATVAQADYAGNLKKFYGLNFEKADPDMVVLFYRTYEAQGLECIHLRAKPAQVRLDDRPLPEVATGEGFTWTPIEGRGGVLSVRREKGTKVLVLK